MPEHITNGEFSLHKGQLPQMVVGAGLAYKMGMNPAFLASAELYFPIRDRNFSLANPAASIETVRMRPSGIFSVNQQIDDDLMIVPIEEMRKLLGYEEEVSGVEIRLAEGSTAKDLRSAIKDIQKELGPEFKVLDRFRQNPSLYKMMRYEKAAIFLILIFVIIIIALNIFGSITMLIIEKKDDIETYRSLGATDQMLRRTFTLEGWLISLIGLAAGLVVGIGFSLAQQLPRERLPRNPPVAGRPRHHRRCSPHRLHHRPPPRPPQHPVDFLTGQQGHSGRNAYLRNN